MFEVHKFIEEFNWIVDYININYRQLFEKAFRDVSKMYLLRRTFNSMARLVERDDLFTDYDTDRNRFADSVSELKKYLLDVL